MGLFTPDWKSDNTEKQMKAVEKAVTKNNKKKLIKIAKSCDYEIREAIVEKTYDEKILAYIAKNDEQGSIREAAVKKIHDKKILADIAKNDEHYLVRRAAVKKINDKKILADIAKNDEDYGVREAAVKKINDEKILAYIAKNDEQGFIREAAVKIVSYISEGHKGKEIILKSNILKSDWNKMRQRNHFDSYDKDCNFHGDGGIRRLHLVSYPEN